MLEKNGTPKEVKSLPVSILHPDPDQPRKEFDPAKLLVLGKSLQKKQDIPLLVYPHPTLAGQYLIGDGERRWRAATLVGLTQLDCLLIPKPASKAELRKLQLRTNVAREAMNPFELADAIRETLREEKTTQLQLAEELGSTPSTVSRWLSIKRLAPDLKPHVENGEVCSTSAYAIAALPTLELQRDAMQKALGPPKLTKDQVVALCDTLKGKRPERSKALKGKDGKRRFSTDLLPHDTHESLIEFYKDIIARISKAAKDGIEVKHLGVLFNRNG